MMDAAATERTAAGTTEVENRPVYAIFEGGGAKGITHVGAIKAAEDVGIDFLGVAGTSAGAIVAALVAVGVKADRLFDAGPGGGNIFSAYGQTPVALLGAADWRAFRALWRLRWLLLPLAVVPFVLTLLLLAIAAMVAVFLGFEGPWRLLTRFGFFDSTGARDLLDRVLRTEVARGRGVALDTIPAPLCFRHIDPADDAGLIRLKIVATNLDRRGLDVFDAATPDVAVADAVVASFSIPFVFRPAKVRGAADPAARYVDGGLVGNLPIWVFNEEKRRLERDRINRPPLAIVAFTLADGEAGRARGWLARAAAYLGNVLQTGVFGSQTVVRSLVPDLFLLDLPSPISTLAFDCQRPAATAAYMAGYDKALVVLRRDLRNAPEAARQRLEALLDEMLAISQAQRTASGQTPIAHMRMALAVPFGPRATPTSLRLRVTANMDDDADDRLSLDWRAPGAPQAYEARDIAFTLFADIGRAGRHMTKYEFALVRPGLASLIAVPIFADPSQWEIQAEDRALPIGVLCVDSDENLEFEYDDEVFLGSLVERAASLAAIVIELGQREVDA